MRKLITCSVLFTISSLAFAGGQGITVDEISGKWKITKFTAPNGNVIPLGNSAYYIFARNGEFVEEIDGSQMKRQYFIEDSKLMIKGPVAGLNFEWDVLSKGSGSITLKTSNKEVIELRK